MTIINAPNRQGLVAYWSFDEGAGGIARDYAGNNHGTLVGNPTWVDGVLGKALSFSGTNKVLVGTSQLLSNASPKSVFAWINPINNGLFGRIFNHDIVGGQFVLTVAPNGKIYGTPNFNGVYGSTPLGSLSFNKWSFVGWTFDGTNFKMYINGVLLSNDTSEGTAGFFDNGNILIGFRSSGQGFAGLIDEVRIYNRAISAAEIATLYKSGQTKIIAPNNNGLAGFWPLDEGAGSVAYDYSGNGNNGVLVNGPSWVDGIKGKCLSFNGTSNYISSNNFPPILTNLSAFAWVRSRVVGATRDIISRYDTTSSQRSWAMAQNGASGTFIVTIYADGAGANGKFYETPSGVFNDGKWHHVGFIFSINSLSLYVDGVLVSSPVKNLDATVNALFNSSANLLIGALVPSAPTNFWSGQIDDVRIYNRSLSQSEITTLYQSGAAKLSAATTSGMVAYYSFDEGSGLVANDYSGNNNKGLLVNGPTWVDGVKGKALSFSGTNYVRLPLIITAQRNFSYALWAKLSAPAVANNTLILNGNSTSSGVGIFIDSTSQLNLLLGGVGATASGFQITPNVWYFYIVVCDASNTKVYLNGVVSANQTSSTPITPSGDTRIGANQAGASNFIGIIDDVRIYNRALSQNEITAIYNC